MKSVQTIAAGMSLCLAMVTGITLAQPAYKEIGLTDETDFTDSPPNWKIAGETWYSPGSTEQKAETGTGILVCEPSASREAPIVTRMEHGNVVVEFDFMLAPGASAAVYLQGRYGINLTDSWTERTANSQEYAAGSGACGSIPATSPLPGIPPRVNVARAPGLWQHLRVVFQAPQFNAGGKKIADARFLQVSLNNAVIHEDIALPEITYAKLFSREQATGPLVFSGNSPIAFRNIRYHPFKEQDRKEALLEAPVPTHGATPLVVKPTLKTIVQRCFFAGEDRKLTFCAAVGEPGQIHYAINLEQGTVIRLWKGPFIDATTMWQGRGALQLAQPLGSVISFPSRPLFASLADKNAAWPDSMQQGYRFVEYRLDKQARPTFTYSFRGLTFNDHIVPADGNRFLTRTLRLSKGQPEEDLWILLAAGSKIKELEKGLYAVDDKKYYIRLGTGKKQDVILRNVNGREELLVPGSALKGGDLTWSFIW